MKFAILLSIAFSIFFVVSAVIILTGKGDWMINNYRQLPEERRAKVNIFRLRKVMAAMLTFIAVIIPFNILAVTEQQHIVLAILTVVALLAFLIAARIWANMPLFFNPFCKK